MVGSNRIVQGQGIVHVMGDADLPAEEEKELRRKTVMQAIEALKNEAATPLSSSRFFLRVWYR